MYDGIKIKKYNFMDLLKLKRENRTNEVLKIAKNLASVIELLKIKASGDSEKYGV
jgi:hypothetical protein